MGTLAHILIIEDDKALQDAYSFLLSLKGHQVTSAYNGKEGLSAARVRKYDVILLDLHMPVMDGLEFLQFYSTEKLSEQSKAGGHKLYVFSNMIDPEIQERATKLGAHDCILKSSMTPNLMVELIEGPH